MKNIPAILIIMLSPWVYADEVDDVLSSPHAVWSNETNSLRWGVECPNRTLVVQLPNTIVTDASFALLNASTNRVYYFWPRELEQRFEIELTNANGKAVDKTSRGKKFGKVLDLPDNKPAPNSTNRPAWDSRAWLGRQYRIKPRLLARTTQNYIVGDYSKLGEFVADCFKLEKSGNYKLTIVQRLYVREAGANIDVLRPVTFAPIIIDVRIIAP